MGRAPARTAPAFRLKEPVVPEDDFHEAVASLLWRIVLPPAEWSCFPAGQVPLPARWAAKLARMGLRRGWPDFLILHDRAFGLELKRRGQGLSRDRWVHSLRGTPRLVEGQETTFPRLQAAGMQIAVAHTISEVLAALRLWGVPMRRVSE